MSTPPAPDEFDAARAIVKTLEAFGPEDQNRILRWAAEKLGLGQPQKPAAPVGTGLPQAPLSTDTSRSRGLVDIKTFVESKRPKNDTQFAAVVAYYYQFEAAERKDSITQTDLIDACRKATYPRPPAPAQTLRNALNAGLLDRAERGAFSVNSVGENLVAVTLPGENASATVPPSLRKARKKRGTANRVSREKSPVRK
jgi:hypothetical protein